MSTNSVTSANDAEKSYNKAVKAEIARDYDSAFRLYISTAESYLHLSRSDAQTEKQKSACKSLAKKCLERAEKIKTFVDKLKGTPTSTFVSSSSSSLSQTSVESVVSLRPIGVRRFSVEEQSYVLSKGSNINGLKFWDWNKSRAHISTNEPFIDPDGQPPFSPEQMKRNATWRVPERETSENLDLSPHDIVQRVVSDCSLCASLSVCIEHSRRVNTSLQSNLIRDMVSGRNRERVDLKFLFNGMWRCVSVDDKLPYQPSDGHLLCMTSTNHPSPVLWPSYVEKGFMKLMGGYDFPGSNSTIDLQYGFHSILEFYSDNTSALIGWIPEHIDMKSSSFAQETTWRRLSEGFNKENCLFTLGTGSSPSTTYKNITLLPSHSYAVVDVKDSEDEGRVVTVIDSWLSSDEVEVINPRILVIPWHIVLELFDGIYLSWNPDLWPKRLNVNGMWRRNSEDAQIVPLSLHFSSRKTGIDKEVRLLLTRHVYNSKRTSEYISLNAHLTDCSEASYHKKSHATTAKNLFTNNPHTLLKVIIPASHSTGSVSIQCSYDGELDEAGFTLSAYAADLDMSWDEAEETPPYSVTIRGTLTSKNSGGNTTYSTFMMNPQYHLVVHPLKRGSSHGKKTVFTAQGGRDLPLNVLGNWSQGKRINQIGNEEVVFNSGIYTYGSARVEASLSTGDYTVVLSAFHPKNMGPFSLTVECPYPFDLKPIPQEGAGMYMIPYKGAWDTSSSKGAPSFQRYWENTKLELVIPQPCRIKIRLQLLRLTIPTALNVTVFSAADDSTKQHIVDSGPYDDVISGVCTDEVSMRAGKYWVVPSTYNPGVEAPYQLLVYSSVKGVKIGEQTL